MEVKAEARYIRVSPQKARLVVDLIRGQQGGRGAASRCAPPTSASRRRWRRCCTRPSPTRQNRFEDVDVDQLFVSRSVRERRAAHEARPPGADGPRLPVSAAHGAHRHQGGGEEGSITNGTESSSVRIPAGLQQALALALVRQAGLRQAAAGRSGAEGRRCATG